MPSRTGAAHVVTTRRVYKDKVYCTHLLRRSYREDGKVNFVSEALELAGATGYLEENFLSKLYRDVKVLEIYEGASLIQKTLIAMETYGKILKSGPLPEQDAIPMPARKAA